MSTNNSFFRNDPKNAADKLLADLEIDVSKPTDLDYIAKRLNIVIRRAFIKEGILGGFVAEGMNKLVVIDSRIDDSYVLRSVLAHEIGHIFMWHCSRYCKTENFDIHNCKIPNERKANIFALKILIPEPSIMPTIYENDFSFQNIENLAREKLVSIKDMASMLVFHAQFPTVIIGLADNGSVWSFRSNNCPDVVTPNNISKELLNTVGMQKEYKASVFLVGLPKGMMCHARVKYYDTHKCYLCLVQFNNEK